MTRPEKSMTFEGLEALAEKYVQVSHETPPGRLERWSFVLGMLVAGIGLLTGTLVGGRSGGVIIAVTLVLELLGLGIGVTLLVRRNWATFRRSRKVFATELDADFVHYSEIVAWLHTFPSADLERKLQYLRARKSSLVYRLGVMTGGIERLGILPLVAVLYLQLKDWEFGNWQALGEVNMMAGLLIWALLLIYLGGWYLIGLRTRLDLYDSLLTEATRADS